MRPEVPDAPDVPADAPDSDGNSGPGEEAAPDVGDAPQEGGDHPPAKKFEFLNNQKLVEWNENIEGALEPTADWMGRLIFVGPEVPDPALKDDPEATNKSFKQRDGEPVKIWYVAVWLLLAGLILTLIFGFINIWGIPLA